MKHAKCFLVSIFSDYAIILALDTGQVVVAYIKDFYNGLSRGSAESKKIMPPQNEVKKMIDLSHPTIQNLFFEQIKALNKR